MKRLDAIDIEKTIDFVQSCQNFDGGFGSVPQAESHSGLVFCCVGVLCILNRLDLIRIDDLSWWLCERQLPNGGLNGRPEKKEDVCYSWWVLSCLVMLQRTEWINCDKLREFILNCQNLDKGGFSDRPGHKPDVFHTLFGVAALSMLGDDTLKEVDPRYCLPRHVTQRLGL